MPKTKDMILTAYLAWIDQPEPVFTALVVSGGDAVVEEVLLVKEGDNEQELSAKEAVIATVMDLGEF